MDIVAWNLMQKCTESSIVPKSLISFDTDNQLSIQASFAALVQNPSSTHEILGYNCQFFSCLSFFFRQDPAVAYSRQNYVHGAVIQKWIAPRSKLVPNERTTTISEGVCTYTSWTEKTHQTCFLHKKFQIWKLFDFLTFVFEYQIGTER